MSPIPTKLRQQLNEEPEYKHCARSNFDCSGRITFEHCFTYAGRQIQARFSIIPLCVYHHLGAGLDKDWNRVYAARRATPEDRVKYPKLPIWKRAEFREI